MRRIPIRKCFPFIVVIVVAIILSVSTNLLIAALQTDWNNRAEAVVTLNDFSRGKHLGIRHHLIVGRAYVVILQVSLISGTAPRTAVIVDAPGFKVAAYSNPVPKYPDAWEGPPIAKGGVVLDIFTLTPTQTGNRVVRFSKAIYQGQKKPMEIIGSTAWTGVVTRK